MRKPQTRFISCYDSLSRRRRRTIPPPRRQGRGSRTAYGWGSGLPVQRRGREAVGELVGERPGLVAEGRLEIRRRDLDPEGALAHLARAEVAEQRQERSDLAAFVRETDPIHVLAALRGAEFPDLFQVDAPVATAHDIRREGLPGQHLARLVGLQIRAKRHARREEPRRRTEADQVVIARLPLVRNPDSPRLAPQLRPEQREDAEDCMPKGKGS